MPFSSSYNNLSAGPFQTFVSRPDLNPPLLNVQGSGTPGFVFFAQRGTDVHQSSLIIADNNGSIVFVNSTYSNAFDFVKQSYQGHDVLTFWDGNVLNGYGQGNYIMLDESLNLIANFSSLESTMGDIHEFHIVNNTALVTIFETLTDQDLRAFGGPKSGSLLSGRFQQIDLCNTSLIFDWRSIDHVSLNESYSFNINGDGSSDNPWDYFHINSIDIDPTDGMFIVSSRHTSTVFKINSTSGDIIWRLGGKISNFTMGNGTNFEWQHDARWRSPTELSLFDNGAQSFTVENETVTRGLRLNLDLSQMSCTLVQELLNPVSPLTGSQGNLQYLDNGNFWMGYGNQPIGAEYSSNGTPISQFQLSPYDNDVESYRIFKMNWTSNPTTIPDIALADGTVFVSWNGATEVTKWNIYTGSSADSLSLFRTVNKTGFETQFRFPRNVNSLTNFTQVGALNAAGKVLALTQVVRGDGETVSFDQSNIVVTASIPARPSFQCLPVMTASSAAARTIGGPSYTTVQFQMWAMGWILVLLSRWLFT